MLFCFWYFVLFCFFCFFFFLFFFLFFFFGGGGEVVPQIFLEYFDIYITDAIQPLNAKHTNTVRYFYVYFVVYLILASFI